MRKVFTVFMYSLAALILALGLISCGRRAGVQFHKKKAVWEEPWKSCFDAAVGACEDIKPYQVCVHTYTDECLSWVDADYKVR